MLFVFGVDNGCTTICLHVWRRLYTTTSVYAPNSKTMIGVPSPPIFCHNCTRHFVQRAASGALCRDPLDHTYKCLVQPTRRSPRRQPISTHPEVPQPVKFRGDVPQVVPRRVGKCTKRGVSNEEIIDPRSQFLGVIYRHERVVCVLVHEVDDGDEVLQNDCDSLMHVVLVIAAHDPHA